jgi:OmcA/MtrC family decaheme c-type cytochrome
VLFPGDRRDCNKCHIGTTFTIPLPATNIATITPANFWSPTQPVATACLACHDSVSTAAHAYLNTVTLGNMEIETCEVCHKEGADFAVSKVHER